jgi:hypothetical protein
VRDGAKELQSCGPGATPPSETCQQGIPGDGAGQLDLDAGAAIRIDGAGDLYASDWPNARVEKFDAEGHFLLAFGEEVDKTSGADVCTAISGHVCGAGVAGEADGQLTTSSGEHMVIDAAGTIYVGDKGRVQEFDSSGAFVAKIVLEGEPQVDSLGIDTKAHVFYATTFAGLEEDKAHIFKYDSSGALLETISTKFKVEFNNGTFEEHAVKTVELQAASPLTVDAAGNLYAVVSNHSGNGVTVLQEIIELSPSGELLIGPGADFVVTEYEINGAIGVRVVVGLATNVVQSSGAAGIYGTVASEKIISSLSAFGALPTKWPPPVKPPQITSQYATSVDATGATLRAQINPRFWKDTAYYVEYGTGECSAGECEATRPAPPGSQLSSAGAGAQVTTKGVFLTGLEPATTYHYRFVAQSSGGGPVRGVGGEVGKDGSEGSFTTPALPSPPPSPDPCENAAFRDGLQAYLPDCRAYEMVSPVEKNGADIRPLPNINNNPAALDVSASEGGKFTYSSYQAFGDALSAPYVSQLMATREADGWSSHAISPPRGVSFLGVGDSLDAEFKFFSEDLCFGWLVHDTDPPLAEGAVAGFSNLYRANLCGEGYEALTTAKPPNLEPVFFVPELQGVSADGEHAVFRATDKLTADANEGKPKAGSSDQLYESSGGELRLVSVLPDGAPSRTDSSAGTDNIGHDDRTTTVSHALSADGSRVYWSDLNDLYLRTHPDQPGSARLHGAASGTGDLIGPAKGTGATINGSESIGNLTVSSGAFTVGQTITGAGIPAGTMITEVQAKKLKISKKATATALGVALTGVASTVITNVNTETGTFAAGQSISAEGIAAGTTVLSANEAEHTLALSAAATESKAGVALAASSPCTEAAKACTVEVAAKARFWDASVDGSRAFYTVGDLSGGINPAKLFEYDAETSKSTLLAGEIKGVVGASEDGSRVYLVSEEALAAGATAGEFNLYLHEAGAGMRFVAALSDPETLPSPFHPRPIKHLAQVSADGLHAVFMTASRPTGFDNTDAVSGKADQEVFLYDASAEGGDGKLLCVSCNPSGAAPRGRELFLPFSLGTDKTAPPTFVSAAGWIPGWERALYASHPLSANGKRIFFNSNDPLLPRDANDTMDVYEWEAPGEGDCEEESPSYFPADGGCIYLITSAESPAESEFYDASPDGHDVFFTTDSGLVPQDPGLNDIYDARVEGGFPQPAAPASCEGEACQSPPEAPNDPTPASAAFEGAGNVVEAPAAKPRRKHHHHKNHKKRHHKRAAKHKRRAAR